MRTNQPIRLSGTCLVVLAATLLLSSCGSTSSLQDTHGKALTSARMFTKVTVQDFKIAASKDPEKASAAKIYFANHIATQLKARGQFSSVGRNAKPDANTLVIGGTITKYEEGSVAKRMLVGMGFGMAVFEANVEFRDSKGLPIGMIKVDKNSWPLGGVIGAVEKPEDFMEGAAQKVAEEAGKLTRSAVKKAPPPATRTPAPAKKPSPPAKKTPTPTPRASSSGR